MRTNKYLSILAVAALFAANVNLAAAACGDGVAAKLGAQPYSGLNTALKPHLAAFKSGLDGGSATYAKLLAEAKATALSVPKGRIIVTLPDGTVAVDTSKGAANTYANFAAKKINENHNTRIAILDAQQYACGVGLETKRSTTDGTVESYVAIRLGGLLDNSGTVRISRK